ncbi:MAG: FKBP-type peptidyl-prolyl cis-trans isomerase [Caulobacteraceae bacterium]
MKSMTLVPPLIVAFLAAAPAIAAPTGASPAAAARPSSALGSPKAEAGYAVGLNVGSQMRTAGLPQDVDIEALVKGLRDGLGGQPPLLTAPQQRAAMMRLQASLTERHAAMAAQAGMENRVKGAAFLKANAAKPGVVTLPSGLQYQVIKVGAGPRPKPTDTVVVNYRGTLIDGAEFDSSYGRGQPAEFPVGGVIKGWTEALLLMPVGSKWRLVLPADLAYGDKGAGPQIGPGAVLVFEVELISIKPA